jgi:hypothetical protein
MRVPEFAPGRVIRLRLSVVIGAMGRHAAILVMMMVLTAGDRSGRVAKPMEIPGCSRRADHHRCEEHRKQSQKGAQSGHGLRGY